MGGLIASSRARLARLKHLVCYVWAWRIRHFWFDKPEGRVAQVCTAVVLLAALATWLEHAARKLAAFIPHRVAVAAVIVLAAALVLAIMAIAKKATSHARRSSP